MGTELHISVPHNFADLSMPGVVDRFRFLDDIFSEISRCYATLGFEHYSSQSWAPRDMSLFEGSYPGAAKYKAPVFYDAPAGFSFDFGPRVLIIKHHCRLRWFCEEPELRLLLRRFSWQVVGSLSGERAIYSPDDYFIYELVFDGLTFDEIEDRLSRSAPPAQSIAGILNSPIKPNYYIDRFEDFKLSQPGHKRS